MLFGRSRSRGPAKSGRGKRVSVRAGRPSGLAMQRKRTQQLAQRRKPAARRPTALSAYARRKAGLNSSVRERMNNLLEVTQQKGATSMHAVRREQLAKTDDKRRMSAHAARSQWTKQGAAGRDPGAPTIRSKGHVRSAGETRKMFQPAKERRSRAGAMFRATTRMK